MSDWDPTIPDASRRWRWGMPHWAAAICLAGVFSLWWISALRALERGPAAPARLPIAAVVLVAVLARLAAAMAEAGFYALAWRALGRRLAWAHTLSWVIGFSLVDLFGEAIARLVGGPDGVAPGWALLLGLGHAFPPAGAPIWAQAFGSLGLFTAVRVWAMAAYQSGMLGLKWAGPLALTAGAWLATHLGSWLVLALAHGSGPWR